MSHLDELGVLRPAVDPAAWSASLLANDLGMILLRYQIAVVLGTDPLAGEGLATWSEQVLDVYAHGIMADSAGGEVASASSVVQTESLAKEFANGRGVHGIDIEVRQGEIFGFLGPNGAGKSTTIRVPLGMAHPTSGHADVLGFDPQKQRTEVLERVGYLPGELALHPRLTGRAHLERMASLRGLHDTTRRDELAERFGANLDRQVRSMSKGERQKIGILLAFMHRPELLVLDEPTSGLDPVMQDQFAKLMRESPPTTAPPSSSPRTSSRRCSASSAASPSSRTVGWSSPTRSTACAADRPARSSSASPTRCTVRRSSGSTA